jgi:hypothetical protein
MDIEDTLTDITDEPESPLEKPKRKVSEKQLLALANAREKRKTKKTALEVAQAPPTPIVLKKEPIGKVVHLPEATPLPKPKLKRAEAKPTIIQFESDDSSGSDSDGSPPAPTIIIRNGNKKKSEPKPQVPEPPQAPRQYIRRAY